MILPSPSSAALHWLWHLKMCAKHAANLANEYFGRYRYSYINIYVIWYVLAIANREKKTETKANEKRMKFMIFFYRKAKAKGESLNRAESG